MGVFSLVEITPAALGAVLQERRKSFGYNLTTAAARAGVSRSYLWEAERGNVNITVRGLVKLAHAYCIEPSELLFLAESDAPEG